jgi:hypothetical protein
VCACVRVSLYLPFDFELNHKVPDSIHENVSSTRTRGKHAAPPPSVVFIAELEVAHEDGGFSTSGHQDNHHKE